MNLTSHIHCAISTSKSHDDHQEKKWFQGIELGTPHLQAVIFFSPGFDYALLKALYGTCFRPDTKTSHNMLINPSRQ
jgi:hypothetical protein